MLIPSEYDECKALVDFLEILVMQNKVIKFSHTANETYTTSWKQKMKNKQMGVRSGVPDYIVVTNKATLFIEMKRIKGGVVSQEQKEWVEAINKTGGHASVCKGFTEAMQFVKLFI